jgi:hypothetical protein
MLTNEALDLLAENHIHIFEVGKVFSIAYDNPKANPKFFYEVVERFRNFIDHLDKSVSMLTTYLAQNSAAFFSNTSNNADIELEQLGNEVVTELQTTTLNELTNQPDIEVELIPDTDTTTRTNHVNNISNDEVKEKKIDMGLEHSYKKQYNSLISDKNKALINNPEHESWLQERINLLLARIA